MSRIAPIDEFVLNHGNPNSADYKRAQSRLELDKLDELKKLNNNGEEERRICTSLCLWNTSSSRFLS